MANPTAHTSVVADSTLAPVASAVAEKKSRKKHKRSATSSNASASAEPVPKPTHTCLSCGSEKTAESQYVLQVSNEMGAIILDRRKPKALERDIELIRLFLVAGERQLSDSHIDSEVRYRVSLALKLAAAQYTNDESFVEPSDDDS